MVLKYSQKLIKMECEILFGITFMALLGTWVGVIGALIIGNLRKVRLI